MYKAYEHFSFQETLHSVLAAAYSVFCHIIFDWAAHGLIIAALLVLASLILRTRGHRLARPFMAIARRLAIFCGIVAAPGLWTLATSGALPPVGVYNVNSIGFICFWSLICAHALGEETNYQLVVKNNEDEAEDADVESDFETESDRESETKSEISSEISSEVATPVTVTSHS